MAPEPLGTRASEGRARSRDELLATLFGERPHPLRAPLEAWISARRFAAFVAAADTKIRKKLRTTLEPEALEDLRLELETAYLLLRERSLSLKYEPQRSGAGRSPDFAVAFTTSLELMVEVTRLKADPWNPGRGAEAPALAGGVAEARAFEDEAAPAQRFDGRFADMLYRKLGQLQAEHGNLLITAIQGPPPDADALHAAMLGVQQHAAGVAPATWGRYGLRDRGEFFRCYGRLSGVLVRGTPLRAAEPVTLWTNPQAKRPLPSKVRTALLRSHAP